MPTCGVCGDRVDLPHQCNECGDTFCGRHRLPETHDCTVLDEWGGQGGAFGDDAGEGHDRRGDSREAGGGEAETALGRVAALLGGKVTYVFLALMAATFGAQTILFPIAGYGPGSSTWLATFVLSTDHPEYVWTWFTSIFAHAGLFHLVLNGAVILFFGRQVEKYVGSKQYTLLFLSTGALAGLSQVGVSVAQGVDSGVLGASGAAMAILGTLTAINPRLRVYLYFVLPIPIWVFTGGYVALELQAVQAGGIAGGGVARFAHLVGLVAGGGYGLYAKSLGDRVPERLRIGRERG